MAALAPTWHTPPHPDASGIEVAEVTHGVALRTNWGGPDHPVVMTAAQWHALVDAIRDGWNPIDQQEQQ